MMLKNKTCKICNASFVPEGREDYCKECSKKQPKSVLDDLIRGYAKNHGIK